MIAIHVYLRHKSSMANDKRVVPIFARVTEKEKNRIQMLADLYAAGNVTAWLVHGALNAPRKQLKIGEIKRR